MANANENQTPLIEVKTDAWENITTALGTSRDKRTGGRVIRAAPNVTYKENEDLYYSSDLAATAAELPAREMVRAWITVKANDQTTIDDDSSRTETEEASTEEKVSLGNKILNRLEELEAQAKVFESIVWARVFGGSMLFLGVDDEGGDNPEALAEPLDDSRIQSFDHITVFDRWDLNIHKRYQDPREDKFGQPELYRIVPTATDGEIAPGTDLIHETRFIRFDGALTNRRRMRENGGWADSIYARTQDLIRDFDIAWHGIANLLQDFSQAVFKMRGLRDAILSDKDDLVLRRMTLIDQCRASMRAVPLDAEDEDFDRKATPVSGMPELMDRFALRMSAAFRMPATLLFGQSPAGMQATGASDIRFFYDQISAQQESTLRPKLERLIKLVMLDKSGPTKGSEPDDWSFSFNPLFQLTELEQADLRLKNAQTDQIYLTESVVSEEEVAFSHFGGDKYSSEIVLDIEKRNEDKLADDVEPEIMQVIDPAAAGVFPSPVGQPAEVQAPAAAQPPQPPPQPNSNEPEQDET